MKERGEEEDGRDHSARAFCDPARPPSGTDETASEAFHHYYRLVSNEQTALPLLLEQLEMAGCIVSIDAIGCLPKIAKQIKEREGEYVLALKDKEAHAVSRRG